MAFITNSRFESASDDKPNPYGRVSDGTTTIAVEYDGGVIVGADSRTSSGALIVGRVSDKLTPVTSHIYVLRSGNSADTQAITDVVKYHLSIYEMEHGCLAPVGIGAQVFRDMCYKYRDDFVAGLLVAGWDEQKGGQVYSIPLGGMIVRQSLGASGSGSTYVYGYLDHNFKPNMKQAECEEFVKKAVALAMSRDGSSGGVIRMAIINKSGVERKLFIGDEIPKFNID